MLPAFAADTSWRASATARSARVRGACRARGDWAVEALRRVHTVRIDGARCYPAATPDARTAPARGRARPTVPLRQPRHHARHGLVNDTGTVPTPVADGDPDPQSPAPRRPRPRPRRRGTGAPGGGGSGRRRRRAARPRRVSSFRVRASGRRRRIFLTLTIRARVAVRVRGTLRRGKRRVRSVTLLGRPGRHRGAPARQRAEAGPLCAHPPRGRADAHRALPRPRLLGRSQLGGRIRSGAWPSSSGSSGTARPCRTTKPDDERELTARGERQSAAAGAALARLGSGVRGRLHEPEGARGRHRAAGRRGAQRRARGRRTCSPTASTATTRSSSSPATATTRACSSSATTRRSRQVVHDLTGARVDFKKGAVAAIRLEGAGPS